LPFSVERASTNRATPIEAPGRPQHPEVTLPLLAAPGKLVVARVTVHQQQVFIHADSTPLSMFKDRVHR
jgi:hypothetical protein